MNRVPFFVCRKTPKFLQVGIVIFDRSSSTFPKYLKSEVDNISAMERKNIATAFIFYCDAKHSGILWGSSLMLLAFKKLWSKIGAAF